MTWHNLAEDLSEEFSSDSSIDPEDLVSMNLRWHPTPLRYLEGWDNYFVRLREKKTAATPERKAPKRKPVSKAKPCSGVCGWCGELFERDKTDRWVRFCGRKCQRLHWDHHHLEAVRAQSRASQAKYRRKVADKRAAMRLTCAWCRAEFSPGRFGQIPRYCGKVCMNKAFNRRRHG
jgi:hypothetical protein